MNNKTDYWLATCDDDLITAKAMLDAKRLLWAGFVCHLVVEKALKAVITEKIGEIPPKIHDLKALAKRGGIIDSLSDKQLDLLELLIPLNIEARYPEYKEKMSKTLTFEKCQQLYDETEEFVCWIKQLLGRSPEDTQTPSAKD